MTNCDECKDCIEVMPIPTCTTDITICDDLGLTTLYSTTYVYLQNLATGHVSRFDGTITGGKVVISPDYAFHPEAKYRIWINNTQETPFKQELMTIEGNEAYCIEFEVFRMFDDTYTSVTQYNATFQIDNRE